MYEGSSSTNVDGCEEKNVFELELTIGSEV